MKPRFSLASYCSRALSRTREVGLRALMPGGWTDADFDRLIEVSPAAIEHYQDISEWRHPRLARYAPKAGIDARRFVAVNRGKVLDGDWDLPRRRFEQNDIYRLLSEHFVDGVPWEETEVFRKFAEEIAAGERRWHWSSSTSEMLQAAHEVEGLYQSMRVDGYRQNGSADAITVSIGRNGELLYNNVGGHHRLSIAKILGLERVPVRVMLRHRSWQDLRDEVRTARTSGRAELSDRARALLAHPDLASILP